ncbi:MAG: hypothetical protein NTU98_08805 [Bacteroidetes bacterium]|nr:hypothetical protein [Bacteroidota bacterium]
MKKAIFTLALALFSVYALNAQDLTSKKGFPILPEKGDYSISIDAVPFFVYFGNMMNGTQDNAAPTWDFPALSYVPMWTVQGKKFLSATTAVRARVRIGYTLDTRKNTILDQTNTSTEPAYVDDKWTLTHMNIVLGAGLEKRKGKGRVQGVYGAMANIMLGKVGNKVVYGNDINSSYTSPLSTDYPWSPNSTGGYDASAANSRVTKDNSGLTYGIGVNVFLGVEYFFAPKMSIGGEFSWGLLFSSTGKSKVETEGWDGSSVKTVTYKSGGTTYFGVDNTNTAGAIMLNFYF